MAVRKYGGKCTCKSTTVIVKMRASMSSNRSEKTYFPPLFDTIITNLPFSDFNGNVSVLEGNIHMLPANCDTHVKVIFG